jgi:Icc-related predicted phosphoesterase
MPHVEAISDMHGRLPRAAGGYPAVPPCDVLVIAGDICPDFLGGTKGHYAKGEVKQANWLNGPFREWLEDVRKHSAHSIVGIAGNHDFVFQTKVEPPDLPWTYLWDSETAVDGLRFYGVPWCPRLGRWAFYADEKRLKRVYEAVPDFVDCLISHGPPFLYGDGIPPGSPFNTTGQMENVGTAQLTDIIADKRPRVIVSGHIHEARGRYEHYSGTTIYNVAYLTEHYKPYDVTNPTVHLKELG